ncbi:hypothetical protein DFJ58DRAFT_803928 [Suillus subalutaceus]|uniref:uncharacterized protein n=1 Tax=Suillus subalutaceus TaxID=48586 RepID=UPI001B86D76B|nr:uncharacterized protein DFJ58DRAFT_803928 [Suillus subalutaceus]KAG1843798.1 hypothetical protein DFJ58DRAFT_803928 [Suillus subalutaceus]
MYLLSVIFASLHMNFAAKTLIQRCRTNCVRRFTTPNTLSIFQISEVFQYCTPSSFISSEFGACDQSPFVKTLTTTV